MQYTIFHDCRRQLDILVWTRHTVNGGAKRASPTNRGSHAAVAAAARGTPKARSSPSGMGTNR